MDKMGKIEKSMLFLMAFLVVWMVIFVSACAINARLECAELRQNNADLRKSVTRIQQTLSRLQQRLQRLQQTITQLQADKVACKN